MTPREKVRKIIFFFAKQYGREIDKRPIGNPFKTLISCVLSQRTRDENTRKAVEQLFSVVRGPEDILKISGKKLEKLIKPSGMYRQKAKRIKQISRILLEKYKGKVPKGRQELMELPGVGFKTADIALMYGYGMPSIAIDVHCSRVPKRIGLIPKDADVEEVKEKLESLFPKNKWYLVNMGFVRFGQNICKSIGPKHEECPVRDYCDFYKELKRQEKI